MPPLLLGYNAKQGHNCTNLSTHLFFFHRSHLKEDPMYAFQLPTVDRLFHFPYLSIFFSIAFKFHGYRCRCHPQCPVNGIHGPTEQQLNRKDGSLARKKEQKENFGYMFSMIFLSPLHQHLPFHCLVWQYLPQGSFLLLHQNTDNSKLYLGLGG